MRKLALYASSLPVAVLFVWQALAIKTGERGFVRVRPHEVAVRSDFLRGTTETVGTPGVRWFVPYFQDVRVLDKCPAELCMLGEKTHGDRYLPELVVRAADGTNFSFEELTLRYQLAADHAARALADSGARQQGRFLLVRAIARGVLRDEFGRFTVEEIVHGANLDAARLAARERLNARLLPHGILVLEVPAATPRFDPAYEQQVLRRRVAEQQVELARAERRKLIEELDQRRAKLQREADTARTVLAGDLVRQRLEAETAALKQTGEADVYHLQRLEQARSARLDLEAQASGRLARYQSEAAGFAERVRAVGARGEQAVREAWIEALGSIELELVPYELMPHGRERTGFGERP